MCDKTQDIVILKTIFPQITKWGLQQNITLSKTNGGFKVPDLQMHCSMDFILVYPYQKGKMKGNYIIAFVESKIQKWVFCLMASINLFTQQFL